MSSKNIINNTADLKKEKKRDRQLSSKSNLFVRFDLTFRGAKKSSNTQGCQVPR